MVFYLKPKVLFIYVTDMKKILFTLFIFISLFLNFHNSFSQGKNMRLVGKLNPFGQNTGNNYSALWGYSANGREYAILGGNQSIYFIDVTDSTNIRVCASFATHISNWHEMKTYSHYAYVVSEASNSGVEIYDLANLPASVTKIGQYDPPGHSQTHSISQEGPYLYLNGGTYVGTKILDLSINPTQPVVRGLWNTIYVHDCRVRNDTIWAANIYDGRISVVSAINKDTLQTIANWSNGPNPFPHNIALGPGRKHMYVSDETLTPPGRLKVWDVEDVHSPLLLITWVPQSPFSNSVIHNIERYGDKLVIAYYSAGVKVVDISVPSSPVEAGWYDTYPENNGTNYEGCWGVYVFPSGKIIASDRTRGLFVLRYAPSQNDKPVADFISDKRACFVNETIQFIDCSLNNPSSFTWKITGPANYTLTGQSPSRVFTALGDYTVKLIVSNSFGSDSITKVNYIRVNGSPLSAPSFPEPFLRTVITNKFDTSHVKFDWSNASPGGGNISYKFRIRKNGQSAETYFLADRNGFDSAITFTKGRLDSIGKQLGFSGDSVVTVCKITAYNGLDSISSSNSILLTLKSTSVGIHPISSLIPDVFRLENNFPNPFNPSTNIKFQLPEKSFVRLTIYDMLGREVQTLLNEEVTPGFYNFTFNASELNSGIYFYKLETNKFSDTKRMVLIK
jgi:choice-of-anchor B domain-containing protein